MPKHLMHHIWVEVPYGYGLQFSQSLWKEVVLDMAQERVKVHIAISEDQYLESWILLDKGIKTRAAELE